MLSVPWGLGWALRPYLQINGASAAGSISPQPPQPAPQPDPASQKPVSAARAQVEAAESIPVEPLRPASSPVSQAPVDTPASSGSSKPYPVVTTPVTKDSEARLTHPALQEDVTGSLASSAPVATSSFPPDSSTSSSTVAEPAPSSPSSSSPVPAPVEDSSSPEPAVQPPVEEPLPAPEPEPETEPEPEPVQAPVEEEPEQAPEPVVAEEPTHDQAPEEAETSQEAIEEPVEEAEEASSPVPEAAAEDSVTEALEAAAAEENGSTENIHDKAVSCASISLKMSGEWAQQQLEKFAFSFDEADADKSGSLSFAEVHAILTKNGFKGSADQASQLFVHLDMNQDNKLSREEFTTTINKLPKITIKEFMLRKAFTAMDKDGSGTLTKAEIEAALSKDAGLDVATEKVHQLIEFLETESKDDVIDYEEFLRVFGVHAAATVMAQIFRAIDKDNSGFLTRAEIMATLDQECELKLRAAKISDLLCAWCKDADKKIDYNEFVQVWIKHK